MYNREELGAWNNYLKFPLILSYRATIVEFVLLSVIKIGNLYIF